MNLRLERVLLALIVVVTLALGIGYAVRTPAWQSPDEPAHYNYIAQVAANGCCPLIEPGDWDAAYLDTLRGSRFAPNTLVRLATVQYEDHQPPLYYLIGSVVFNLTGGNLTALRLLSLVFGVGVVIAAYALVKALFPTRTGAALGTAALVGFVPQHLAMMSSVNNDSLAELLIALTLVATAGRISGRHVPAWGIGALIGAALITKVNTLFLIGLIPLVLLVDGLRRGRKTFPLGELIGVLLPALVIAGVWWARNLSVYGVPDFLGLARHDAVVVGQLRTADLIAQVGAGEYLRRAVETTFNSFWGQFGWMALPLPGWSYTIILMILALALIGWLIMGVIKPYQNEQKIPATAWLLLGGAVMLGLLQYVYYNTEFVQFQGRYIYTALVPLAIFAALGWDAWGKWAARSLDAPETTWRYALAAPTAAAILIPLNVYFLWRVIPQLAP